LRGLHEEVASFLGIDAAKEEEEALAPEGGAEVIEGIGVGVGGSFSAERDQSGPPAGRPKGMRGESLLAGRGEEDSGGGAQVPKLGEQPIELLA
jgi:hypothetical protein